MSWLRKQFDKQKRTRGRRWMSMKHVVLVEEPVCMICGREASIEVDHKIPLNDGGTDERSNLQGIGKKCHEIKTANDLGYKIKDKIGLDGYPISKEDKVIVNQESNNG